MIENKRFTLKHYEDTDWAYDNGKSIYTKEMVELLNEQDETITRLEEQVERLLDFKAKVFDSLNDKIRRGEQGIEWGEQIGANVGAMGFHIELLKRFRKELFGGEAELKVNALTELLDNEVKKNAVLLDEINSLRIENMRLKELK